MPVVALLATAVEGAEQEVCILSEIVALPEEVLSYVQKRVPTFNFRYSKTVQGKHYANICPSCGMLSGDFSCIRARGTVFCQTCEAEAGLLYLTEIPIQGPVAIQAGYHIGTGELILNQAKRIA